MQNSFHSANTFDFQGQTKNVIFEIESNSTWSLLTLFWSHGWCVFIINPNSPEKYKHQILNDIGKYTIISESIYKNHICADPANTNALLRSLENSDTGNYNWMDGECALVLYTSGSTGCPKGVCHSMETIKNSAHIFCEQFNITSSDKILSFAPIHSMSGFRTHLLPSTVNCGIKMIFSAENSFLDNLQIIIEYKPTHIICGPAFVNVLSDYCYLIQSELCSIKALLCTGAHIEEAKREKISKTLHIPVVNYYGLTETSGIVLSETIDQQTPYQLPKPCTDTTIILEPIYDQSDTYQLIIESPRLFLGYYGTSLNKRQKYATGDIVTKQKDGSLKLIGRMSNAIKSSNTEWIYPSLLEDLLKKETNISDVVVKACNPPYSNKLHVIYESTKELDLKIINMRINKELGSDYEPLQWTEKKIIRNQLGKLTSINDKKIEV